MAKRWAPCPLIAPETVYLAAETTFGNQDGSGAGRIAVSGQLLRRVGAVQVRPLGARQNAELDDAP
jgi:hypothetical protein